uniref:CBM20 domain-containing protein n=1 Tax=Tetradesmus obliquus TaxID=3088 RepID=A0A383VR34_TETOB
MLVLGVGPLSRPLTQGGRHRLSKGLPHKGRALQRRRYVAVRAIAQSETAERPAPAAPSLSSAADDAAGNPELLASSRAEMLESLTGPIVKISVRYHTDFGDCMKVIGSSAELGAWDAAAAPLMVWGEGDIWSLVLPFSAGEHEFKVVVQKSGGELLWEGGDNRKVVVPEDAPAGSMLVAECSFNFSEQMEEPELEPLSEEVVAALQQQAEATAAAELQAAASEGTRASKVSEAAAAIASAMMSMDVEAEVTGRRPSFSGEPTAASTPAAASPASSDSEDSQDDELLSAATGASGGLSKALAAAQDELLVEEDEASAAAESEMQQQLEAMAAQARASMDEGITTSFDELADDFVMPAAPAPPSAADSLRSKLSQDKPVAVGFIDFPASRQPAGKPAAADPASTNSVVAAFMKSVSKKAPAAPLPTAAELAAAAEPAAAAAELAAAAEPAAAAAAAAATEIPSPPEEAAADLEPAEESAVAAAAAALAAAAAALSETEEETDSAAELVLAAAVEVLEPAAAVLEVEEAEEVAAVAETLAPAAAAVEEEVEKVTAAAAAVEAADPAVLAVLAEAAAAAEKVLEDESRSAPATPDNSAPDSGSATPAAAAAAAALPSGWGPSAVNSSSSSSSSTAGSTAMGVRSSTPLSSRSRAAAAPVVAGSNPKPGSRSSSPGRNGSHVASAAAAASIDWVQDMHSNEKVAAAREAEEAAKQKAARLAAAKQAASAAAAESEGLDNMIRSSRSSSPTGSPSGSSSPKGMLQKQQAHAAAASQGLTMPAPPEVVPLAERAQQAFSRGSTAALSAAAAAAGLSPPAVASSAAAAKTSSNNSSSAAAGAAALAADSSMGSAAADSAAASPNWDSGMQLMSAIAGCAAVGTVLWSEFVLKDTGCGLPPGPYGLLGAAEGISYLTVLGFAGAGAAARGASGGKAGLPGALKVPEVLAYGALAAGLFVLASQLREYGYIPPPLPGGQCYPDAAVMPLPGTEGLSAQLAAQLAALQGILHQLQSSAADGIDQLALQEQLAALQQQADTFSAYVAQQTSTVDASLRAGLLQLQDSLASATDAVSSFADTQLQQLDIPGKLAFVLDVLKQQEQALVVELPKQFAELQQLAATSVGLLQETASQAANGLHLPELLASLDRSMGALHDVLEVRIQQLDVVLSQLHDSCSAAATQLAAAAFAAQQAGATDAAAQLNSLQQLLSGAIASVQEQVWAGYQQLALADHLSESLLHIRSAAAAAAAATTAEVDKLQLQQQLAQLESVAEQSLSALSANAMDKIEQLQLKQRLSEIEVQANAAAASLQAGLLQAYEQQLPALQQQLAALQDTVAGLAADAQRGAAQGGPQLDQLLTQLQQSMEATVKVVEEVAASGADSAGQQLQVAGSSLGQFSGSAVDFASGGLTGVQQSVEATVKAAASGVDVASQQMQAASSSIGQLSGSAADFASSSLSSAVKLAEPAANAATAALDVGPAELVGEPSYYKVYDNVIDLDNASDAIKEIWANRPQ